MDGGNEITAAPACVPGAAAGASIADPASPVAPAEAQERAPKQNADRDGLEQKDSVNHFFCLPDKPTLPIIFASG
jgi:hypothetical protein